MDNCGHDLSYRCSSPARSRKRKASEPFRRAAYTLDGQGLDLSSKYPYAPQKGEDGDAPSSNDWLVEQQGFRSLYTMDWKPCTFALDRFRS
jgi:hypothetical protein